MVETYICPACGADLRYDAQKKKMTCEYCGWEGEVSQVKTSQDAQVTEDIHETAGEFEADTLGTIDLHVYRCSSCGAEILTNDDTVATFCSFCGRPAMLENRVQGEKKPAYVIPFRLKKEAAQEAYALWAKKGVFTPKLFYAKSTIEKVTGMYVPFWLYDYHASVYIDAHATRVSRETHGNYAYIYTDHYQVVRELELDYSRIPADASVKMPDDVMDKLEPFRYGELEQFEMPYLSGYYAEKYNYTGEQMAPRIEYRVRSYANQAAMSTIVGYASVNVTRRQVRLNRKQAKYALLPVWILHCKYKGKDFLWAMNGQTGKIVAEKPRSAGRIISWFTGLTAVIFAALFTLGSLL